MYRELFGINDANIYPTSIASTYRENDMCPVQYTIIDMLSSYLLAAATREDFTNYALVCRSWYYVMTRDARKHRIKGRITIPQLSISSTLRVGQFEMSSLDSKFVVSIGPIDENITMTIAGPSCRAYSDKLNMARESIIKKQDDDVVMSLQEMNGLLDGLMHDIRRVLIRCADHITSVDRTDIGVSRGNTSTGRGADDSTEHVAVNVGTVSEMCSTAPR